MKTNKERIEKLLQEDNIVLDAYDNKIDKVNAPNLKRVLAGIKFGGDTDIFVHINRVLYIVEISYVSSECDMTIKSGSEYFENYGYLRLTEALDNEDITQREFNKYKELV